MTTRTDLTAKQFMDLARAIWDEAFGAGHDQGERSTWPQALLANGIRTSGELWDQSNSRATVENLLAIEATPGGDE